MATVYRSLKMIDRDLMEWWEILNVSNWEIRSRPEIIRTMDVLLEERFEVQQRGSKRNLKIKSA